MSQTHEYKVLAQLLRSENKPVPSESRRTAIHVATWFGLAVLMLCVFQFAGTPTKREWLWIAGAFALGLFSCAYEFVRLAQRQWAVLRDYVNFDAARARLRELES